MGTYIETNHQINLLVSFLDEDNPEILNNIRQELLALDQKNNAQLRRILSDIDNAIVIEQLKSIIVENDLRFFETELFETLHKKEHSLFDLLCIVTKAAYPDIDVKSLSVHFNKIVKDIWLALSDDMSALDAVKELNNSLFKVLNFKIVPNESTEIKHLMLNDVLIEKETNILFFNYLYLCIAKAIELPVVPLNIFGLMVLSFQNKGSKAIELLDSEYLFFIDNATLNPYPEHKLREKYKIDDAEKLSDEIFSNSELISVIVSWLSTLYEQKAETIKSQKLRALSVKLKEHFLKNT